MKLTREQKERLVMAEKMSTHEHRIDMQTFCLDLSAQLSILSEKGLCQNVRDVASRFLGPLSAMLTQMHGEELLTKLLKPHVQERSMELMAMGAQKPGEKAS